MMSCQSHVSRRTKTSGALFSIAPRPRRGREKGREIMLTRASSVLVLIKKSTFLMAEINGCAEGFFFFFLTTVQLLSI